MNNLLLLATIQMLQTYAHRAQTYAHRAQTYLASSVERATCLINNLPSI
jgi:hypothetical protein